MVGRLLENHNKYKNNKKTKRGGRKYNRTESLILFSTNAAGLKLKIDSLKNEISECNAAVFTIQETHFAKKGKFKLNNYEIYDLGS